MADKELSPLQKEFRQFFSDLLDKFGVDSPAELTDEQKREFFDAIAKYWQNGKGPKKDPKDIKVGESIEESKIDESPVGAPGRTSRAEALEFIAKNPEKIKELKKIIKQAGGKTVFMELVKIILDPNFDEEKMKVKVDDIELMRLKKIEKVLQGTFI
jgi:hypothetical protein